LWGILQRAFHRANSESLKNILSFCIDRKIKKTMRHSLSRVAVVKCCAHPWAELVHGVGTPPPPHQCASAGISSFTSGLSG
jgi:hypothetical protein